MALVSDDRYLHEELLLNLSRVAKDGYIHSLLLTISILTLFISLAKSSILRLKTGKRQGRVIYRPSILYAVTLQAALGLSVALSLISSIRGFSNNAEPVLLGYVFGIHFIKLMLPTQSQMLSKSLLSPHVALLLVLSTTLAFLGDIVPSLLLHRSFYPSFTRQATTGSLFLGTFILSLTPRTSVAIQSPQTELGDAADQRSNFATPSPEEYCSLFSYCVSYGWLDKLIFRGCRHALSLQDLPSLPHYDEPLLWLSKILDARRRGNTQLKTVLLLMHRELLLQALFAMATAILEFVAPFAMNRLLFYLQSPQQAIIRPVFWVVLLFLGPMARSVSYQQYIFTSTRLIVRVTNAMIQEIYHKAMGSIVIEDLPSNSQQTLEGRDRHRSSADEAAAAPLNQQAKSKTRTTTAFGAGHIMNLMSFDVDAIESARDIVLVCVAVPIEVMIATGFLYTLIGWSAILGLVAMIFTLALPAYFSHKMVSIQQNAMKYTDKRISKISEYLNAIRVIKYFGWEEAVANVIQKIRKLEQEAIYKRNLCAVVVVWSGDFIPLFSLFIMFTTYVLTTRQPLRADTAFTCLAVVETLRQQFIWVSNVSGFVSQAAVSLRRLDRFFQGMVPVTKVVDGTPSFQHATFIRSPDSRNKFCLEGLHFDFLPGSLNVVTGPTGSGKTTLLLSLLGETILVSGAVKSDSNAAYVSQTPWLKSGTIRDNIIFHSTFERTRYEATVNACGLVTDFDKLPKGDLTEIAEQGSSLSGGQRLRVALARAVYSSASTLLLDDIFSCLDIHTVNHIFNELFRNRFLGTRTVILVSHLSPVIDAADLLVRLAHGRVVSVDVRHPVFTSVIEDSVTTPESSAKSLSGQIEPAVQCHTEPGKPTQRLENMLDGRVPRTLFLKYMFQFGGLPYTMLALFTAFLTQVAFLSIPLWLSQWTGAYTKSNVVDVSFYLGIYACVLLGFNLMVVINNLVFQHGNWKAARELHARLTSAVLNSPIKWFDQQPIGVILNRFSQDIQSLDSILLNWLRMSLDNQLRLLLRIGSIASILPIFALPAATLCSIGFVVGEIYTRSQISIKRLTSATRSPIFAHFSDTLIGLPTIRAQRGMKEIFGLILADHLRDNSRAYEALYNSNRWVSVRADAVAASVSAAAGIIAIMKSDTISAGLVGFSLTNAIGLSQTILTMVRNMNELEVELNSFQRVAEFTALPSEEAQIVGRSTRPVQSPPASWPSRGEIEFRNFSASYGPNSPDVIKGISLRIRPGERVGIVGRTGSSKSSLALSILRFTHEKNGFLYIDGIDTKSLPLNVLRRAVTIIPQDSTIFSGDLRSNLDPFDEMDDTELNNILQSCSFLGGNETDNQSKPIYPGESSEGEEVPSSPDSDLRNTQMSLPCKEPLSLSTPVAIGGSNFSKGERQTLCLARAVCRRSKIVIVDEATSSVDSRTDAMIQNLLRTEFAGSTVLTIAHRLETVMDYDRILVMSAGEVVELDTPRNLLDRRGLFWNMVKETGKMDELIALAK